MAKEEPVDLFSYQQPREEPKVLTVTEVTRAVRVAIEGKLAEVWVEGEVSNHRRQPSGHQYFTLKDAESQLSCVLFAKPGLWHKRFDLQNGMQVRARGRMTVYEARGQYQLNVTSVEAAGAGLLQAKFEALKRRLSAEGLFDSQRKRALPKFPAALGIVTSPTGAALQDMLDILSRRAPWLHIVISPARVQGEGAAEEVKEAMEALWLFAQSGTTPIDVIVIARGGGSIEDLWAFNDEALARAIADSPIPVVSAVGHEIDFTIADFVADLRAPTPSAAAEIVAPDSDEFSRSLDEQLDALRRASEALLRESQSRLEACMRSVLLREPERLLEESAQRLDLAITALERLGASSLTPQVQRLDWLEARLQQHRPGQQIALRTERITHLATLIEERLNRGIATHTDRLKHFAALLTAYSPQHTLRRGFTWTRMADGALLHSASEVKPGSKIVTQFADGEVESTTTRKAKRST